VIKSLKFYPNIFVQFDFIFCLQNVLGLIVNFLVMSNNVKFTAKSNCGLGAKECLDEDILFYRAHNKHDVSIFLQIALK
jgi:hypothetical protein